VKESKYKQRLIEIIKEKSLLENVDRVLTSGRKSRYYIDAKMTTLDPEGADLVARFILEKIKPFNVEAIGGYTLGADPIVSAVAVLSFQAKNPIPAFIVRKESKQHGEMKMIEGPFKPGWRVAVVDDVVTTGGSTLEGGRENLEKAGYAFISLLTRDDLLA